MKDRLIFPSQVYILGIWTADLALTSTEILVSCLLMLMCLCPEMNGAVTGIYLYSSYMAVPPDPGHFTSPRRAPASVIGSQQIALSSWFGELFKVRFACVTVNLKKRKKTADTVHLNLFFFFLSSVKSWPKSDIRKINLLVIQCP